MGQGTWAVIEKNKEFTPRHAKTQESASVVGLPFLLHHRGTVVDVGGRFLATALLQLPVLSLRLLQNRNVGIGVFPEGEEVLIGGFGFGGVALHGIRSTQLEMSQYAPAKFTPIWRDRCTLL